MEEIGFNIPHLSGKEMEYIQEAVFKRKISGDGFFTKKCHSFFEDKYAFAKVLLTTSCTDALEMAAILMKIEQGDEVIMPSYTFVSTANAFVLRGAKIVFADSQVHSPNIDENHIESLITSKTKAIVVVHYAGVACNMDLIVALALKYKLFLVEDAAQAIDSYYKGKPLGTFGHFSTFSFHETKNIMCGEGGMLVVNDEQYIERAEIIREKGTNRSAFFRGDVAKYGWVDIGSSFLPSDILAAFLFAQLESLENIQNKRKALWNYYYNGLLHLQEKGFVSLPLIPAYATNNAHMFYIVCRNLGERTKLIQYLQSKRIQSVFHYISLHKSTFYKTDNIDFDRIISESDRYTDCLLRLPMYYSLSEDAIAKVIDAIETFFKSE